MDTKLLDRLTNFYNTWTLQLYNSRRIITELVKLSKTLLSSLKYVYFQIYVTLIIVGTLSSGIV